LLLLFVASARAAAAQDPSQTPTPTPVAGAAAPAPVPVPAPPKALTREEMDHRRDQMAAMEGILTAAVRSGAQATARQIQEIQPGLMLFTGTARTRGFALDGYGLFFHVEIPGVRPSVAQLVQGMERDRERAAEGRASRTAESSAVTLDPGAAYTLEVQKKLVDGMLSYRLDLGPSDWLTVAARDADGPIAGEISESVTMIIRLKGSDLADFHAGRLTRAEILKRVEVRGF